MIEYLARILLGVLMTLRRTNVVGVRDMTMRALLDRLLPGDIWIDLEELGLFEEERQGADR